MKHRDSWNTQKMWDTSMGIPVRKRVCERLDFNWGIDIYKYETIRVQNLNIPHWSCPCKNVIGMISLTISRCQEFFCINFSVRNKLDACSKCWKFMMQVLFWGSFLSQHFSKKFPYSSDPRIKKIIWKIHLQKTTAACFMMKNFNETHQDIKRTKEGCTRIWQCLTFPDSSSWTNTNGSGTTRKAGRGKEKNEWWRPFPAEEGSVWQPGHPHLPKPYQLQVVLLGGTTCTDVQLWTEPRTKDREAQLESSGCFDVTVHLVTWSIPQVFSSAWHVIKNVSGKIKF